MIYKNLFLKGVSLFVFYPLMIFGQQNTTLLVSDIPKSTCVIENLDLRIIFNKTDGLPYKYELLKVNDSFLGADSGKKINVIVRKLSDRSEELSKVILNSVVTKNNQVCFNYIFKFKGFNAGSFEIHYNLQNLTVLMTLENVKEVKGYHLIELITDNLVTLRQEDGNSSFVYNKQAGKLVDLASAKSGNIGQDNDVFEGFPNMSVLPVVAFIKPKSICTMEVQGFCNKTVLDIVNNGGNNHALIGVHTLHYQRGGINTPDLIIKENNICRIDFAGDYDGNGTVNWLDAAKMVCNYLPPIPTHYFDDKYMWIIHGQVGRHDPETSFDEVKQLTKRISTLIDNNPQICYISGWCEGGHDTGYPNIYKINPLLGGEEAFLNLKDEAKKKYNATISFDDNYDDQYNNEFTTGVFDKQNIAKNIDGKLMTFNAWNGNDTSYITGMAHYMRHNGPGEARVDYTAKHYGIQDTELIDAATWWTIRPDYDTSHPASAPTNLIEGKFKLFDRFKNKYGINIISELLRFPALGHLALVCDGPNINGGNQYGGAGTDIPFLAVALRKSIYYGCPGGKQGPNSISNVLYNNNIRHGWLKKTDLDSFISDIYYTNYVPWFKMHNLDILSFVRNGNVIDMALSENSSIHLSPDSVIAKFKGNIIINGEDITCPLDDHRIAFYSKTGKVLSYPLPLGTLTSSVKGEALYSDHRENLPVIINNGLIMIHVLKQVPVIVYLDTKKDN